jgi:dimethylamine--corrinoid protein Co-methyltransferase
VETTIMTRMGDGSLVEMTRGELRAELEAGVEVAVKRAKVPPLSEDELAHLLDIYASSARFSAVDIGDEVVLSVDGVNAGSFLSTQQDLQVYEQDFCLDIIEVAHSDYSYKAVKAILPSQAQVVRDAQLLLTVPLNYGAMPNLGLYSQPDGPVPNWSELLPLGRIDEARQSQEDAVEYAVRDMVAAGEAMWEAGADGMDFDTAGAAGDGDFLATLRAVELLRIWASRSVWRESSSSACTGSSSTEGRVSPACGHANR